MSKLVPTNVSFYMYSAPSPHVQPIFEYRLKTVKCLKKKKGFVTS